MAPVCFIHYTNVIFQSLQLYSRILPNGERGPTTTTSYFGLPVLQPPIDELVALLDVPPMATLHKSITMTLTIRNNHPSRSANVTVHLDLESLEGFVVSGIRNGRVPVLLPGSEETLVWQMIPLECGYVKLPRIKVIDRRSAIPASAEGPPGTDGSIGELVKVIDHRHDFRSAHETGVTLQEEGPKILVLP